MAILGFIFLVFLLVYMTASLYIMTAYGGLDMSSMFSKYTGFLTKIGFIILWIGLIGLWYLVITNTPFTILIAKG